MILVDESKMKERIEVSDHISISGVTHICGPGKTVLRRLLWCVTLVAALIGFIILIKDRIDSYTLGENTSNQLIIERASVKFPSLTICQENAFTQPWSKNLYFLHVAAQLSLDAMNYFSQKSCGELTRLFGDTVNTDYEDVYKYASYHQHKLVTRHVWNGQTMSRKVDSEFRLTQDGVCVTYTPTEEIKSTDSSLQFDISGFPTLSTARTESSAVKLLIHPPGSIPFGNAEYIRLRPGTDNKIILNEKQIKIREDAIPNVDTCIRVSELVDQFPDSPNNYPQNMCRPLMKYLHIKKRCNCTYPIFDKIELGKTGKRTTRICTIIDELECVNSAKDEEVGQHNCCVSSMTTKYKYYHQISDLNIDALKHTSLIIQFDKSDSDLMNRIGNTSSNLSDLSKSLTILSAANRSNASVSALARRLRDGLFVNCTFEANSGRKPNRSMDEQYDIALWVFVLITEPNNSHCPLAEFNSFLRDVEELWNLTLAEDKTKEFDPVFIDANVRELMAMERVVSQSKWFQRERFDTSEKQVAFITGTSHLRVKVKFGKMSVFISTIRRAYSLGMLFSDFGGLLGLLLGGSVLTIVEIVDLLAIVCMRKVKNDRVFAISSESGKNTEETNHQKPQPIITTKT
ncbi:uncharacterized protein LOC141908497 [Tubulanus polymorphus]|uniref:uncharacterized protein LOC141908497 n=1 Tax=Tubulanus polymorphus TaxID=672921 RepID=UPI003DA40F98